MIPEQRREENRKLMEYECALIAREFRALVAEFDQVPEPICRLSFLNQFRLLNLRVFSLKYHVPMRYVVHTLLRYFKKVRGPNPKGLPKVSIAALTGDRAEEIIKARIAEDFPDNEHEHAWKSEESNRLLQIVFKDEHPDDLHVRVKTPDQFVQDYRRRIMKQRRERTAMRDRLARRPWRGNPWR
jgi:hypothetical protein